MRDAAGIEDTSTRKKMYFSDVEERATTTNSAAVLSRLLARSIVKKISTEGQFQCGAVECEATRQDVEAVVNKGLKTQVSIDDRLLFVCEVIDKNLEEEYIEDINESADRCHASGNHNEVAWDDVSNCGLDPTQVREARKAEMEYFQKLHCYKKVQVQICTDVTGRLLMTVRRIDTHTHKQVEANTQVP